MPSGPAHESFEPLMTSMKSSAPGSWGWRLTGICALTWFSRAWVSFQGVPPGTGAQTLV